MSKPSTVGVSDAKLNSARARYDGMKVSLLNLTDAIQALVRPGPPADPAAPADPDVSLEDVHDDALRGEG